jgi:hypothetical protein
MKKTIFWPLAALILGGCSGSSNAAAGVKFVTPVGAPALAFYDQGANQNWVSTSSPETIVVPAFGTDNYDAIVFDGISGLNLIRKNGYGYRLAQWVSGGNFYLVSVKHQATDAFDPSYTVDGFVKTGNAAQSFLKLAEDEWGWPLDASADYPTGSVKWETGVATVLANLTNNPEGFDYYLIAEPMLTSASAALKGKGITLNGLYDLQEQWRNAYSQATIPAAALFVNVSSYAAHKEAIEAFLDETQSRQDKAVQNSDEVVAALNEYGSDDVVQTRFGFTASLVANLQKDGADRFGILKTGDIADPAGFANAFAMTLNPDASAFGSDLFLTRNG